MIEKIAKVYTTEILLLNVHITKYTSEIENDIKAELLFISDTSLNFFKNIAVFKKESRKATKKLSKLKAELEEIYLFNKKSANAEKNYTLPPSKNDPVIIAKLKEINELEPQIAKINNEVSNKTTIFNKTFSYCFERLISCLFKCNIKIKQTFYLLSKEKYDYYEKIKKQISETLKNLTFLDF